MEADILPPSDDRVFKLILTSPQAKPALMDLVQAIIKRPVTDVVILNNELPVEDTREKAEHLDVNCKTGDGLQIDLEMQASRLEGSGGEHKNLKAKSIYYLCDLHSSQPSKGVRRYDKLAHTYQVTFCSYTVFPDRAEYVNSFSMRHDEDNGLLTDVIRVIYFESKEALQMAGDLLLSVTQDERERAIARSRRMFQTDMQSDLATAEDNGELKGRITVARNLIKMNMPLDQIVTATGLTREEVENLFNGT